MMNKGFTLLEMLVVTILVAILAMAMIPAISSISWNSEMRGFENNMVAIEAAQQKYFEDYGTYCGQDNFHPNPGPGGIYPCSSLNSINQMLGLTIPAPPGDFSWEYYCQINLTYINFVGVNTPNTFLCTIQNQLQFSSNHGQDMMMCGYNANNQDSWIPIWGNPNCQHAYNGQHFACP